MDRIRLICGGKTNVIVRFAALMLMMSCAAVAHAEVRKWVDKEGRAHYSDQIPAGVDASKVETLPDLPLPPLRPAPAKKPGGVGGKTAAPVKNAAAPAAIEKAPVWIYTTRRCGYCAKAKDHLARRGVPYTELDVEASESARDSYRQLNARGVPVILVGNKRVNGYSPQRLDALLRDGGY